MKTQSVTRCSMDVDLGWPGPGCVWPLDLWHAHSSWIGNSLDESQLEIFADAASDTDLWECLSFSSALSSLPILELMYNPLASLTLPSSLFSTTTQEIQTVRWHCPATCVELPPAFCPNQEMLRTGIFGQCFCSAWPNILHWVHDLQLRTVNKSCLVLHFDHWISGPGLSQEFWTGSWNWFSSQRSPDNYGAMSSIAKTKS